MYVEPDCNIPTAESLVRQCLYGQQTYKRMFGKTVNNAWLPDVFGNSWILPQILKKSGVDYFVSNKMSTWNDTNRFPHNNFIWKVLTARLFWLAFRLLTLSPGICRLKFKKIGRLISIRTAAVKL